MPSIGEIKRRREIGYKGGTERAKYIWCACIDCGKERWEPVDDIAFRCPQCAMVIRRGANHPLWKGGRVQDRRGYISIRVSQDDFFYPMASQNGYVKEHRLVIARRLRRCLLKSETVHHKNGIKDDNRSENLELISPLNHTLKSELCGQCGLRKEIRLLRWQMKEQSEQIRNLTSKLMGTEEAMELRISGRTE